MNAPWDLVVGDCIDIMRAMSEESVDAVVTDPPYGLKFMGKDFDRLGSGTAMQAWHLAWAREALRILKPGGHLLAFGGSRTYHRLACAIEDAGLEVRDQLQWIYGSGFPKNLDVAKATGDPQWEGWGTALKPAHEPIVLARRQPIGTVAANLLTHGTGALNIGSCRVPLPDGDVPKGSGNGAARSKFSQVAMSRGNGGNTTPATGRWPANVVLDEEAGMLLDVQSGVRGGSGAAAYPEDVPASVGGASRFYYCAKASKSERGAGNDHPTVKPIALMRWLVRLVTPRGGIVLDPFAGSGTTLVAARLENFTTLGIERDPHYAAIARSRLESR